MDIINADNRTELVKALFEKKSYLPDNPVVSDLVPFLYGRMRTKRLRKKFLDHHARYWDLLPYDLKWEFIGKRLARPMVGYIRDTMSREGFTRRLFKVEPVGEI